MDEMMIYQEQELGQSYEQAAKLFTDSVASKEEVNRAYVKLARLEHCIRNVTERLVSMVKRLESDEDPRTKRTGQMNQLLDSIVTVTHDSMIRMLFFQIKCFCHC